jgi:hypothetical protein
VGEFFDYVHKLGPVCRLLYKGCVACKSIVSDLAKDLNFYNSVIQNLVYLVELLCNQLEYHSF